MSTRSTEYSRAGITSDDSVPSASTVGVSPVALAEVSWYLTADSESDTCTVRPWYKRGDDWHKGDSQSLTGSSVVLGYSLGRESWLQLTSVTGTWRVRADLVEKQS